MGHRVRRVRDHEAIAAVRGCVIANVSSRDVQFSEPHWLRSKSADSSCHLGPCVTTADAVENPHVLGIRCSVNGEFAPGLDHRGARFYVPALISSISASMTLEPGDVILTWSPRTRRWSRSTAIRWS